MNHSQKECHKNIRDNKACVDNKGNKFWLKLNMASKNPNLKIIPMIMAVWLFITELKTSRHHRSHGCLN
jgi:hypothetical protein